MCLAIPGKVTAWLERETPFARARVAFGGVEREVGMQCLPEAVEGDYVLVHAGVAISRVDADEAEKMLRALDELELADEEAAPPAAGGEPS